MKAGEPSAGGTPDNDPLHGPGIKKDETADWRRPALRPLAKSAATPSPSGTRACRLQKTRRLTLPAEFARVKGQGMTQRGRYLVLGTLKLKEERVFRVGFVTPKHIGGAVVRNRVRRRLRDIVRNGQPRLNAGLWLVVVARPYAANASYAQLKDEWLRLAERASILAP
jgi:ribonuclease P protein component